MWLAVPWLDAGVFMLSTARPGPEAMIRVSASPFAKEGHKAVA